MYFAASGGNMSGSPSLRGGGAAGATLDDSSLGGEYDVDEDGAHDTITSLAGASMLQKYRRSIRKGSRDQSPHHLSGGGGSQRLEDLFLIEEDGKDEAGFDESLEPTLKTMESTGKVLTSALFIRYTQAIDTLFNSRMI